MNQNDLRLLRYNSTLFDRYFLTPAGDLWLMLKRGRLRPVTAHVRNGDYLGYNVKNPTTGKQTWIMKHVAVLWTFGEMNEGQLACHKRGTARSDGGLGSCEPKDHRGNRHDRRRDGTHSTGHNSKPGKLSVFMDRILQLHAEGWSTRALAEYFGCTRQAIRKRLHNLGRL